MDLWPDGLALAALVSGAGAGLRLAVEWQREHAERRHALAVERLRLQAAILTAPYQPQFPALTHGTWHGGALPSGPAPALPDPVVSDVPALPGVTDLGTLLAHGWRPTPDAILLGLGPGGAPLTVPAGDLLCHVAFGGKTGAGKCLGENEYVFLANGRVAPARALVGHTEEVLGVTDLLTMRQVPTMARFADNGLREVINIELDNGIVLQRTLEHPLWAAQLSKNEHVGKYNAANGKKSPRTRAVHAGWVEAQDLRSCGVRPHFEGHVILCPRELHQNGTITRPDADVVLCAALLAEGGLTRPNQVRFTNADALMVAQVATAADYYGCELVVIPPDPYNYRIIKQGRGRKRPNPVLDLVRAWDMQHPATAKRIPEWVFMLPTEQIALFLRVFMDCDGWVSTGPDRGPSVNFTLANPVLVEQIAQLALRLGITGTIHHKANKGAGAWTWSTPQVDIWQARIGALVKVEALARAVVNKAARDGQAATQWKAWRTARPEGDQSFADCPPGYEWRKVVSVTRGYLRTVSIEVYRDNHAYVGYAVEHNTNLMRLFLTQLCAAGAEVYLCDPHYAPVNPRTREDWRPIAARLQGGGPVVEKAAIVALVDGLGAELDRRLARWHVGADPGPVRFYAIEELPLLAAHDKAFMGKLGRLLREGRKLGLYVIVAAQDLLVSTLGGSSGLRAQFQTLYYGGGDDTTRKVMVGARTPEPPGRGVVYLRSAVTPEPQLVRVPLVTNADVEALLGAAAPSPGASQVVDATSWAASPAPSPGGSGEAGGEGLNLGSEGPNPPGEGREGRTARAIQVRDLVRAGTPSSQIIQQVWGVTGGKGYQAAAQELTAILAGLLSGKE